MTWLVQVRHVFAKDVRHGRVMLGLYVLLVAVLAAHFMTDALPMSSGDGGAFAVVMLAMIAVATAVQDDSPHHAAVFWATKPIAPSAMLAAKAMLALSLIAIAVTGQAIALSMLDVSASLLWKLLLPSIRIIAVFVAVALIVGAITRSIRGAVLMLLAFPVAFGIIMLMSSAISVNVPMTHWFTGVAVVLGAWFLVRLYATRNNSVARRLIGVAAAGCLIAGMFASSTHPATATPALPDRIARHNIVLGENHAVLATTSNEGTAMALVPIGGGPQEATTPMRLPIGITIPDASRSERRTLVHATARVVLKDGSTISAPLALPFAPIEEADTVPRRTTVKLPPPGENKLVRVALHVTRAQRTAIENGYRSITVEGEVQVEESYVITTLPLRDGARAMAEGKRVRLSSVAVVAPGTITATVLKLGGDNSGSLERIQLFRGANQFVVLGDSTGTPVPVVGFVRGGRDVTLVLPGAPIARYDYSLALPGTDDQGTKEQKLEVLGWRLLGSYRTTATMEMR